jgi:hypothetical protein
MAHGPDYHLGLKPAIGCVLVVFGLIGYRYSMEDTDHWTATGWSLLIGLGLLAFHA